MQTREIPLAQIHPSRWQPRSAEFDAERLVELAHSIRDHGLINPITVFPINGHYELVAGERRTRATIALALANSEQSGPHNVADYARKLANIGLDGLAGSVYQQIMEAEQPTITARIEPADDLARLHTIAVVENLDRQGLTPLEEARGYQSLIDAYGWTQRELARRVHKSQGYIAQRLALLNAAPALQEAVATGALGLAAGRSLSALPTHLQQSMTETVLDAGDMTTRQIETLARNVANVTDPAHWDPDPLQVYTPRQRNYLRLLRWAAEKCAGTAPTALALSALNDDYLLERPASVIAASNADTYRILHALLPNVNADPGQLWQHVMKVTCETCVWRHLQLPPDTYTVPCVRHRSQPDTTTCTQYIGPDDPILLGLPYLLYRHITTEGSPYTRAIYEHNHDYYLCNIETYNQAIQYAQEQRQTQRAAQIVAEQTTHIDKIRAYWDAQQYMDTQSFQAHGCEKCTHYTPLNLAEDLPPCHFAREPLACTQKWNRGQVRAPHFGLLCGKYSLMPRCEMFAYPHLPRVISIPHEDFSFPRHRRSVILRWLRYILDQSNHIYKPGLFGLLSWLDYRRAGPDMDKDALINYIKTLWDQWGDATIAWLIDAAIAEVNALNSGISNATRATPQPLIKINGDYDDYVITDFDALQTPPWFADDWPAGYRKPWELQHA